MDEPGDTIVVKTPGLDTTDKQLRLLHSELAKVEGRYPRKADWVLGLIMSSVMLILVGEAGIQTGASTPPFGFPIRLAGYLLMIGFFYLVVRRINTLIRQHQDELPDQIRRAGLIERLAMGSGELPDIFAHTLFPWRLFLGKRPTTFAGQAKLVANNLDWYLLPEPKRHFRFIWLWYIMFGCILLFQLIPLWSLWLRQLNLAGAAQYLLSDQFPFAYLLCIGLLVLAPFQGFELNRLVYSAEALRKEVQMRIMNADCGHLAPPD